MVRTKKFAGNRISALSQTSPEVCTAYFIRWIAVCAHANFVQAKLMLFLHLVLR